MGVQKVLAKNMNALVDSQSARQRGLDSNKKIADRLGISDNTVGRMRRAENVGIDVLGQVAHAFGLSAWQLLVDGLDPEHPPTVDLSEQLSPDELALILGYRALSPLHRIATQNFLHAIVRGGGRDPMKSSQWSGPERRKVFRSS